MTVARFRIGMRAGLSILLLFSLAGCAQLTKNRQAEKEQIAVLSKQVNELSGAKLELEDKLRREIDDKQVKLNMMERGLVITFIADILFDSGKARLRAEALPSLDKVVGVLNEAASRFSVGVEGHTDNEPIKYSGWKSNWELSVVRALSVLHYLEERGVTPSRLSASGFGEYQPVSDNSTREGRQSNRRVEIVIYPRFERVKSAQEPLPEAPEVQEPAAAQTDSGQENLK